MSSDTCWTDASKRMQAYVEALGPLAVSDTDLSIPGTYNSHYQKLAAATPGDVSAKMKRLQRELRNLNTKTQLPVHSAASIFVRHDSERIDKMRVIITGAKCSPLRGRVGLPYMLNAFAMST